MDIFFSGFFVDSSDKENPTFNRALWSRLPARSCSCLIQVKLYTFKYTPEVTWCHAIPAME